MKQTERTLEIERGKRIFWFRRERKEN